jgi:hypothetical protein
VTRRPVLPGAAELFRRTDVPAPSPPPVTELSTLAAAQSSPALRSSGASRAADDDELPATPPLTLVPDVAGGAPRIVVDELAAHRSTLPAAPPKQVTRATGSRGRAKHEEKITVYCSADELLALETARLALRGQHGVAADRGRIVREAIAVVLADLEVHGEDSVLVRRLRK